MDSLPPAGLGTLGVEPMCCDTPMVHNSWTCEYECADAYFALLDDGVLGDVGLRVEVDDLTTYQRERYEHWMKERIADLDHPVPAQRVRAADRGDPPWLTTHW